MEVNLRPMYFQSGVLPQNNDEDKPWHKNTDEKTNKQDRAIPAKH